MRLSHLGDIAQAIPLMHVLRDAWPAAEIGWAIQPEFAPLVAPLARVFPFDRQGGIGAWRELRRGLRAWSPDLALDAQGNWKSAVATRLSGARRRVGFHTSAWQEPAAARILRIEGAPEARGVHLVDRCLALGAHVTDGADAIRGRTLTGGTPSAVSAAPVRLDPDLTREERAAGEALLAELVGDARAPIVLHPGAPGDPRTWPAESYAELARTLLSGGDAVLILTGPAEAATGAQLRTDVGAAAHLVDQRGLRELAALFAAVAARDGRLVVGDSGPAHVAASVGLGVALLAGPEDPSRTGPWPVVGSPDSPHRLVGPAPWTSRRTADLTVTSVAAALKAPNE